MLEIQIAPFELLFAFLFRLLIGDRSVFKDAEHTLC
jgi:hypothetical protein